jgi:trans-aconitate methyltransferase
MFHEDRRRASSFGEAAEQYDRTRPTYPTDLIDYLVDDEPKQVLDVGCGTGIAARLLAARGCHVLGLEADGRMAEVARAHDLTVEQGTFEQWDPAGRQFDLLTSAQAWHWVDPVRGAEKAAEALRSGGRIGLFWNRGQPPAQLQSAWDTVYLRMAPELGRGYAVPTDEDCQVAADALQANGHFEQVASRVFAHTVDYTTAQWLDQLPTHSDHRTLPADQLAAVLAAIGERIDQFGGQFEMAYNTWLVEARTAAS